MKRTKRTFTQDERILVFDLWKQGAGFSDIGRIIEIAYVLHYLGHKLLFSYKANC